MRREYCDRRDLMLERLGRVDGLRCHKPGAGMFVMCEVGGLGLDGRAFAEQLLDAERVSVVPGDAFGASAGGCVRIGLAQPRPVLKRACKRIREFIEALPA